MSFKKRLRLDKQGRLPDESFNPKVIESCAKTYLRSLTQTWKGVQSNEGKERLKLKAMGDRRRNRRSAVGRYHNLLKMMLTRLD